MTKSVGVHEAKTNLSKLLERVSAGEEIAITRRGEEIARLAEKYWAERGWPEGSPEQDWLRAEQELKTAS